MKILNGLRLIVIITTLTAGVSVLTTGCSSEDRKHETAGENINDDMITQHVASALEATSDYKFSDVHVATFKGRVQLSGFVDTGSHKDQAADVARKVEGVKDVVNNITVK